LPLINSIIGASEHYHVQASSLYISDARLIGQESQ